MNEPTTEAGRAAYNLIREPLIYGVRDRLDGHHAIAWAVRDGLVAAEAEARATLLAELRVKVKGSDLPLGVDLGYSRGYSAALSAVITLIDEEKP